MIRVLVFAAALTAAPSAFAQTAAAPTASAAQPAPELSGEAAFEAKAEAFGKSMETMQGEMAAVVSNAAGDRARRDRELDTIEARYQAEADTFATAVQTFAAGQAAMVPPDQQAAVQSQISAALDQIRGVPKQIRASVVSGSAAAQAAPAPAGS